ncbi:prepilin peptidase [Halocynthiibacter sp. C4]|uniref:prepilin peptidase n=1 Tax=Halocynthiibacter sp. C4 TaxID=2992758 RepID=UPI00237AED0A|nr:prepilin peptidase [Halocynthiibacter sp. C4]MDE0588699.1 prepilin peptidase [Halocynthiibacter sp. C4]
MDFELAAKAAMWFLPLSLPICFWVAYSDLKSMKIPNKAMLALLAVYAIVGLFVLPMPLYLAGWLNFVVMIIAGFIISSLGVVGAGDAKILAAMAPFIARGDIPAFAMLLAFCCIVAFALHRAAMNIAPIRNLAPNWQSWSAGKDFPAGLGLASAFAIYLVAAALGG